MTGGPSTQDIAAALLDWRALRERNAHPERSPHPWQPARDLGTGRCQACGKVEVRWKHAVEREVLGPTAAKCVAWSFGLPLGARP